MRLTNQKNTARRNLLRWYDRHKRDLPWRLDDPDPYRVWISEVMLQQTRVAVVIEYYGRFLRRFPTVQHLARAKESDVLAMWSGLGYYRRARMLHAAAKQIVNRHSGSLPKTAAELESLPGIGRYTAAAIASICYAHPCAVVDGNVERVLQRLTGRTLASREQWSIANDLICPKRPGDFNQAVMELGATVCTPMNPKCSACPLRGLCRRGTLARAAQSVRLKRELAFALDRQDARVRLVRRKTDESLMPSMWELPPCTSVPRPTKAVFHLKHSITKTDYSISVYATPSRKGRYVFTSELAKLPLTGLTRKILRKAGLLS